MLIIEPSATRVEGRYGAQPRHRLERKLASRRRPVKRRTSHYCLARRRARKPTRRQGWWITLSDGWVRACVASNGMNSRRSRGSCRTAGSFGRFGGTVRSDLSRAGAWLDWYVAALGRFSCDLHSESATKQETYNSNPRQAVKNFDTTMYAYTSESL
jgi:hypothetical protein